MEFMDEKIQALLNEAEKAKEPHDIRTGPVRVGKRYYAFEEQPFFDGKLTMYVPQDFTDMPEQVRKVKYPYEARPPIVKSDETGSIAFTLNRIDHDLQEEWVEELTNGMRAGIRRTNPAHLFFSDGTEEANGNKVGYFEFKSSALDGFMYQLFFFFVFHGKTGMGTFSCRYADYDQWRDIAFQVMRTIHVLPLDDGEEQE
ncbi:hypothetical protein WJ0W_002170 [Paenibacillus melissococcoides]|uniref:Uncharacterized protein n=1 Tax=Paenibacillus melissococcoides TaxID=2912268 RepID=A0ABM9G090_9BACL|nr:MULTISPECIES: hypothetical protein [Paenibacillus]GIO82731.1 hypothetical protein J6TS7_63410 [Paenibacillus dendritiformis]CAH8244940.1 hypothetical protein WJ0W_002170 [Paenibacillus melissococcoides]CAH8709428.1 hypothetical protein WDD9_002252 [Paenibacillus melissococcoides]CAH8710156.1 hypothetical protein HTL2_002539 [Paenibacillus melissococcoides]